MIVNLKPEAIMKSIKGYKITLTLVFMISCTFVQAQQQSQYTQFMNAGLTYNPAEAIAQDQFNATLIGRWQWVGFEGAPNTQGLIVSTGIPKKNIGLGLVVDRDQVAVTDFTRVRLNTAYGLPAFGGKISMGISASLNNLSTSTSEAYVVDPDATFAENTSISKLNFGFGFLYQKEELWMGISVPEVFNSNYESNNIDFFNQKRHLYFSGGYGIPINESIMIRPNVLVRMVSGSPLAADFNVMGWYNERFGLGLSHRLDESIDLIVQLKATEDISVGYAFDYVINEQLSNLANTSHEVMITYRTKLFKTDKSRKTEVSQARPVVIKPEDSDQDGLTDDKDQCPNEAGPASNQGCPLADEDNDGVPDVDDQCPDVYGKINGCPDSDDDGIIDPEDNCPDAAGLAANNGCPDTDGDGVMDHLDHCPEEAGLVSNKGCPQIAESTKEVLAHALEGVQFESSKDVLKASSYPVLEEVVELMKANPAYRLKISGYTDSSGNDELNLRLSQDRAEGVKKYLVEKGIEADKIDARGYGETNPIADNETNEGRAKNRRVEFEIVF